MLVADFWGWNGWDTLVAITTTFLGTAAFISAVETRRQRRNLTRPELVDIPPDPESVEEPVEFGEDYSRAQIMSVPTTHIWFDRVETDLGNWVCTVPLRNTGTGSAKLLAASLKILRGPDTVAVLGHRTHQFVPPNERVRLVFYADAPGEPDAFTERLSFGADLTATVSYADFEEGDVYMTTLRRRVGARGGQYQDVQVARVGGGARHRAAIRKALLALSEATPRRRR